MNLCIIARADLTGLGVQSRNWVRLLNPQKLVVINSTIFNGNEQHFEWYNGRGGYLIDGLIKHHEINAILKGVDVLLTFEIPYSYELIRVAKQRGVKTIIQNNWEFTDYLRQPELPFPDLLVNHSYWNLDKQKALWPEITEYCPTPLFIEDFDKIMLHNMNRLDYKPHRIGMHSDDRGGESDNPCYCDKPKRRFLHVAGRRTHEDRNGTKDLIEAMKMIPVEHDFELVIKAQTAEVPPINDPRVTIDTTSPVDEKELYRNFDALILPRRYGGACLPMNEALAAGMPVVMPNIDPNNKILPKEWLVAAEKKGSFMTRTMIDLYSVGHWQLASKIIDLVTAPEEDILAYKIQAREIACNEYSSETVKEKWALLLKKLGV